MKKFISVAVTIFILFSLSATAFAEPASENSPLEGSAITAIVRNTVTGEIETYEASPVNTCLLDSSEDGEISLSYEVFIPLPNADGIMPLDSESNDKTSHGVTATVGVDYTISSNGEEFKASRFYGSWTPSSGLYYVTQRQAAIDSGGINPTKIIKYPTSDSYSFYTNWGYKLREPNSDYQQQTWSVAVVYVGGMESSGGYEIYIRLPFASI